MELRGPEPEPRSHAPAHPSRRLARSEVPAQEEAGQREASPPAEAPRSLVARLRAHRLLGWLARGCERGWSERFDALALVALGVGLVTAWVQAGSLLTGEGIGVLLGLALLAAGPLLALGFAGLVTACTALLLDLDGRPPLLAPVPDPARAFLIEDSPPRPRRRWFLFGLRGRLVGAVSPEAAGQFRTEVGVLACVFASAWEATDLGLVPRWVGVSLLLSWGVALVVPMPGTTQFVLLFLGPFAGPLLAPSVAVVVATLAACGRALGLLRRGRPAR